MFSSCDAFHVPRPRVIDRLLLLDLKVPIVSSACFCSGPLTVVHRFSTDITLVSLAFVCCLVRCFSVASPALLIQNISFVVFLCQYSSVVIRVSEVSHRSCTALHCVPVLLLLLLCFYTSIAPFPVAFPRQPWLSQDPHKSHIGPRTGASPACTDGSFFGV